MSVEQLKRYLNKRKFVLLDQLSSYAKSVRSPTFQRQIKNVFGTELSIGEAIGLQNLIHLTY
jgi:hypothetical protein